MPDITTSELIAALTRELTLIDRRDLFFLVKVAFLWEEITTSKAAELLGLPLEDFREMSRRWVCDARDECDVMLAEEEQDHA